MGSMSCTHTMDNEPECSCFEEGQERIEELEAEIERLQAVVRTWPVDAYLEVEQP